MFTPKLFFVTLAFVLVSTTVSDKTFAYADEIYDNYIISDGSKLYSIVNSKRVKIKNAQQDIVGFDDCQRGAFYFTVKNSETVKSVNSTKFPSINQPEKWQPTDVAADCWNEKFYFIDELAATINVHQIMKKRANDSSSHFTIVLADLNKPTNLVINPFVGLMFFAQASSAIYRAGLDGSQLTKIIERNGITSIALDPVNRDKNLFWGTGDGSIEVSDYQGRNYRTLQKIASSILGLAVSKNYIAWSTPATWNRGGYVYISENLADSSSANASSIRLKYSNFQNPKVIKVKQEKNTWYDLLMHPCATSGCQHMCLPNADLKPVCACQIGWQLKEDLKTCEPIEEFILYIAGNSIRGKNLNLNKESFTEAILPIFINDSLNSNNEIFSFDYDSPHGTFMFSNANGIYHKSIISKNEEIQAKTVSQRKLIAVDWMTGNVYFAGNLDVSNRGYANTVQFFVVYNQRLNKDLHISMRASSAYTNVDTALLKSLAIHPMRGYLFYSEENGIFRMNTDFTEKQIISESDCENPRLAIDYAEDRVYWLCEQLKNTNLHGNNLQTVDLSYNIEDPRSINVYQDWIFISNLTGIWRFNKKTGKDAIRVVPKYENDFVQRVFGVKVFSPTIQTVNYEHPCAFNNGGCEQICYGVPKENSEQLQKVCACDSNFVSVGTLCF